MKKIFSLVVVLFALSTACPAQKEKDDGGYKGIKKISIPAAVKVTLAKKYPAAFKVTWEKENGNYEANWGGSSGEDNSAQFTPSGEFIEIVKAIPAKQLPAPVAAYIKEHFKGAKITEAGRVTDAQGTITYEAEVNRKDMLFDEKGSFIKIGN